MEQPTTLQEAIKYFDNYANCKKYMVQMRWPEGVRCPLCGSPKVSYLENARVWKCYEKHERPKFSLKTGTVFEDSPLGLDKWLPAMWMTVNCKNGVSSWEIHRELGITQKTAWFMLQRIRLALQGGAVEKLAGTVEVDETFIGGKARNMHASRRRERGIKAGRPSSSTTDGKMIVMGLLERHGKVKAKVVRNTKRETLHGEIKSNVQVGANVYTDDFPPYYGIGPEFAHQVINHAERYVDGVVHTNGMENFWSLLKRGINGTYISVEPYHLFRYIDEQAYRFNNRKDNNVTRFNQAVRQITGKRITYKELIGKDKLAGEETSAG